MQKQEFVDLATVSNSELEARIRQMRDQILKLQERPDTHNDQISYLSQQLNQHEQSMRDLVVDDATDNDIDESRIEAMPNEELIEKIKMMRNQVDQHNRSMLRSPVQESLQRGASSVVVPIPHRNRSRSKSSEKADRFTAARSPKQQAQNRSRKQKLRNLESFHDVSPKYSRLKVDQEPPTSNKSVSQKRSKKYEDLYPDTDIQGQEKSYPQIYTEEIHELGDVGEEDQEYDSQIEEAEENFRKQTMSGRRQHWKIQRTQNQFNNQTHLVQPQMILPGMGAPFMQQQPTIYLPPQQMFPQPNVPAPIYYQQPQQPYPQFQYVQSPMMNQTLNYNQLQGQIHQQQQATIQAQQQQNQQQTQNQQLMQDLQISLATQKQIQQDFQSLKKEFEDQNKFYEDALEKRFNQMEQAEQAAEIMRKQFIQCQEERDSLTFLNKNLQEQIKQKDRATKDTESVTDLKDQVQKLKLAVEEANKQRDLKFQENSTLKEIVDRGRAEVAQLKKKASLLEDKCDQKDQNIQQLKQDLEGTQRRVKVTGDNQQLERALKQVEVLEKRLQQQDQDIESMQTQMTTKKPQVQQQRDCLFVEQNNDRSRYQLPDSFFNEVVAQQQGRIDRGYVAKGVFEQEQVRMEGQFQAFGISNKAEPDTKVLDDKLMHLQMEKQGIEMQLDKIPEAPKSIAQRQKRQDLIARLDRVNSQVTQIKGNLREITR